MTLIFNSLTRQCGVHSLKWSSIANLIAAKTSANLTIFRYFGNETPSASTKPQQITVEEAKSKAQQILQYFPGDTLMRKATYATIAGGLTAFLVANGIYIPNDETLILVAFLLVSRILYVKLSAPLANLIDGSIEEMRAKLSASRAEELKSMSVEIDELEELRDFAVVHENLFQTKGENIVLEAQLGELLERNKFLANIKAQLDDTVRRMTEKRIAERKQLVEAIMAGVLKELKDSKLQDKILKKSIADLQRMPLQTREQANL